MKLNWGTGITIFIIIFVVAIASMIIKVSGEKIELVTENYYEQELNYQEEINAMKMAMGLDEKIAVDQNNEYIFIKLPVALINDSVRGEINFYRPSDKKLDKKFDLLVDSVNVVSIPRDKLKGGLYKITIDAMYIGEHYRFKSDIVVNQ